MPEINSLGGPLSAGDQRPVPHPSRSRGPVYSGGGGGGPGGPVILQHRG